MAVSALPFPSSPSCLSRSYVQVACREPSVAATAAAAASFLGRPLVSVTSPIGLLLFRSSSSDLCQCGGGQALSCSFSGRKDPSDASALSAHWRSKSKSKKRSRMVNGQKRISLLVRRGIKISREAPTDKEKEAEKEEEEDDPELCPVECVREFTEKAEFDEILQYAKDRNALVVVDFFKTACGSCRYIETGFAKLCKGAGDTDATVIFLKHNVMDEYEEPSDFADNLRIKVVPMFQFYKDGKLVESFPTREKSKILEAICKHTGLHKEDVVTSRGVV